MDISSVLSPDIKDVESYLFPEYREPVDLTNFDFGTEHIPEKVMNLINANAQNYKEEPRKTIGEGQIVCVRSLDQDFLGDTRLVLTSHVYALLNQKVRTTNAGDVWSAWLVTEEREYATEWDLLLGNENFEHPACEMIQVWNTVEILLPTVAYVCGEVQAKTLANVRHMHGMFSVGVEDPEVPRSAAAPAPLPRYFPAGSALTGTWLDENDANDQRNEYYKLYSKFAQFANEAVAQVV